METKEGTPKVVHQPEGGGDEEIGSQWQTFT